MSIRRRALFVVASLAVAGSTKAGEQKEKPEPKPQLQLIDHWIFKHAGNCGGCAVSDSEGKIVCSECRQELDVLVSEIAFRRMAEALQRAHHALVISHGLQ